MPAPRPDFERSNGGVSPPFSYIMMKEVKNLPPRLAAIASMVPRGGALADVGTDHALLPLWLLRRGHIPSAVATDIHEAPLERTRFSLGNVRGLRLVLCDGLDGVSADEVDTVVIAGLGGDNMADILSRAPWCREGRTVLLQPMSKAEVLRRALHNMGYRIESERLVEDNRHVYPILLVRGGEDAPYTEAEYYTGRFAFLGTDPLFADHLERQMRRIAAGLEGLEKAGREGEGLALRTILREMDEMRRKMHGNGA